jgi:hypothetical protein
MEEKIARREHNVTDQGNGGAYCSECHHDLTQYYPCTNPTPNPCPGCGLRWVEGGLHINYGGSDF